MHTYYHLVTAVTAEIGIITVTILIHKELDVQRESQKEINKYCILTHIYVTQNNSTKELICMVEKYTDIQKGHLNTVREGDGGMN